MSGKITHRLAAAGICALVAAGSCTTAAAFGHSYYLPEVSSMNITVPGDLITITRDASEGDSYFATFHQDYAATMQDLQTNNIYLQGMDSDASLTVTVTMIETADSRNVGDYNQLSSEQLSEIAKNFLKDPAYTACRVDKSGKEVNWLQFDTAINGAKGLLANTVVEGRSINVSMNRNGSNVTEEDGKAFNSMISGVNFGERNFFDRYGMMILVAIAAILVVAVIAMIIIRIVRSRGSEKPTIHDENEKILEELAGKYARKPIVPVEETEPAQTPAEEPQPDEAPEPEPVEEAEPVNEEAQEEEAPAQAQEGELLGAEDIEDFIFDDAGALPAEEDAPVEKEAAPAEDAENDDFFAGSELTSGEVFEAIETSTPEKVVEEAPVEEEPVEEEPVEEAPVEEAPVDEVPVEEEPAEEEPAEEESEPDEFEEYMNDEVLVRQNAKSNKFKSSSDFFDEAPRKSVGVISSRDLEEAEEYDVIGEEEKRADEVKREEPKKKAKKKGGSSVKAFFLGFLMGCKSFFTHCGYFITNVSRAIKRSHAKKKRKKAEEERRRRARERAAQQRAQSQNREQPREKQRTSGGLVQVRSRGDRRPQGSTQRRPQSGTQRRPQSGAQRRPQSGTQRRPASGRPPQKRRPSSSTTTRRR